MSREESKGAFVFHTEIGFVLTEIKTVRRFDIEDIIRNRAISQARAIQFMNLGRAASVNDPRDARTVASAYTQIDEELRD